MLTFETPNKRVVIVYWKKNAENPFEVFSSLKNFCLSYKQYNYNTLSNYLSKGKIAYENEEVRVERKNVFLKPKPGKRDIVPVVRKVLLADANDEKRDLDYWLSKTPKERATAVTFIISQSIGKHARIDKTKIVKRKLNA